jgi:hypothetical protein
MTRKLAVMAIADVPWHMTYGSGTGEFDLFFLGGREVAAGASRLLAGIGFPHVG